MDTQFAEIGPRCRCSLYLLGDRCPYCECNRSGFSGEESPTNRTRAQMREDAAIRLEESRRLEIQKTEEQIERARAAVTSPETLPAQQQPERRKSSKPSRAPRRTKAEMVAARAKKAAELAAIAARVTPEWLATEDPAVEAILAGTDVEEAMQSNVTEQITALLAGEDGE